jgi:hypothetical protein
MSRGLTTGQTNAIAQPHVAVVPLLEMIFDSGTLRLALNSFDIVSGGNTYVATGPVLSVQKVSESASSIEGVQFTMSGLDPAIIALATQEPYQGRIARLLKAYVDPSTNQVIGNPLAFFPGRMRSMSISETNSKAAVTLTVEHFDAEFDRPWPLRFSNTDQQRLFPGDRGCEYAEQMTEKSLVWPAKEALRR